MNNQPQTRDFHRLTRDFNFLSENASKREIYEAALRDLKNERSEMMRDVLRNDISRMVAKGWNL